MSLDRRTFLKNTAVASAAVMIMPSCVTSSTQAATPKIGLGLFTLRNELAKDVKGTLERVAKIGYKKIEPFGIDGEKVFGLSAQEMKQLCDDLGLEFVSGHVNPDVFMGDFEKAMDFFKTTGQEYAVWPWLPEEMRTLDNYKMVAESLNKCGEIAKKSGVQVCYHNHDFEFFDLGDGVRGIDILANETDSNLVKFEFDLYWVSKAGASPLQVFEQYKERIPLWHVKDMANTPEQGFAEVGEGTIDYPAIFAKKDLSGMKHFFVEQDASDDPFKSIETSYNNLVNKILV